ncbi:MAG TPA: Gfo/Idh/MocA family oxidoreductase [Candidatus Limnocylindrales bacterium]|nr:Gfo/Idh/MocA family oxidoreductase [Candidatus Limnocylindrales bacterium]
MAIVSVVILAVMCVGAVVSPAQNLNNKPVALPNTPKDLPLAVRGPSSEPLRVVIAGMVHGHVDGFLSGAVKRKDVEIVGIAEADRALFDMYAKKYGLDAKLYHSDLEETITAAKPQAVLAYTNTFDHRKVVEICAKHRLAVMMEKPLAVSAEDAHAMAKVATEAKIPVLVNYFTTWEPSRHAAYDVVYKGEIGEVRKVVSHDGHKGPKEIGVGPEFLGWLTDPKLNGGGALYDFGCYGADFMTWLMNGERPLTVTAVTLQIKPDVYPKVDDDATIVLTYPKAQAILQASWNWPFGRNDVEVYGKTGTVFVRGRDSIEVRTVGGTEAKTADRFTGGVLRVPPLPEGQDDPISYLRWVVLDGAKPEGPGTLEINVVVAEIMDAARESAKTGRTVKLGKE